MKRILLFLISLTLLSGASASAQVLLANTTLSSAITDTSGRTINVTSATGIAVNTTGLFIDHEYMQVRSVSGTRIGVDRGMFGTPATTHANSSVVVVTVPAATVSLDPSGSCTLGSGLALYSPVVNTKTGHLWTCRSSVWKGTDVVPFTYNSTLLTP